MLKDLCNGTDEQQLERGVNTTLVGENIYYGVIKRYICERLTGILNVYLLTMSFVVVVRGGNLLLLLCSVINIRQLQLSCVS